MTTLNGAYDKVVERVPVWALLLLAGFGTPTAVGTAIWSANQQSDLRIVQSDIRNLTVLIAEIRTELSSKVSRPERLEMLANLNERLAQHERAIERLQQSQNPGR